MTAVGNPPILPQFSETALEEVVAPLLRAAGENKLDGLADGPVSEECPASKTPPTQSRSSVHLEEIVCDQIASSSVLAEHKVARLFGDARRSMESSPWTKIMMVMQTVVNQSLSKAFQNSAFYGAVKRLVHKYLAEPQFANDVMTRTVDPPAFTVRVPMYVAHVVVKLSLVNAEMTGYKNVSKTAILALKT